MTQKRWILGAAVLGSGIVFLDSTVVNVAMPRIGQDLPRLFLGVLEGQSYVYNGYLLTLSSLLILAGAMADYYGRRRMFAIGTAGFGAASVLCGLSPNMEFLVVARIIQGAFGALLVPGSLALITSNFEGEEQGRAFGIWAGAGAGLTILGPFVGGLLVDTISWRAVFLINVPFVLLALYALRNIPESRDEASSGDFDWLGATLAFLAVGGLAIGAIYGQQRNWQGALPFVFLAVGAASLVAFPFVMARRPHPLVPLGLFSSRNFTVVNISTLVIYGSLYVTFLFNGLFLQGTIGYTAAAAGLVGIPGSLLLTFFSARVGRFSARYGPRWFMTVGPALMGLGVLLLARVPSTTQAWHLVPNRAVSFIPPTGYLVDLLPGLLLFGIGLTIMVAPLTTALMTSVPAHNSGLASAINNAISRVGPQLAGAAIFVAITGSFYSGLASRIHGLDATSATLRSQVAPLNAPNARVSIAGASGGDLAAAARQASTDAYHLAMFVGAGLLFAGAIINGLGIRTPGPAGEPATRPEDEARVEPGTTAAAAAG
ncbi:MAG: MFS transporter [Candidatus Dormibacteria bacterium]